LKRRESNYPGKRPQTVWGCGRIMYNVGDDDYYYYYYLYINIIKTIINQFQMKVLNGHPPLKWRLYPRWIAKKEWVYTMGL